MKITDAFTLYHKANPSEPHGHGAGVKPVTVIDKIVLHPGQLFRGEVLGEDANGHLLLKVGGEIIVTRGLFSMPAGQQIWVEVKEVGDSPLFALAQVKGAVHELLKNIMEVRPAVLAPGKGESVVPPEFQVSLEQSAEVSFVPKLMPLAAGGTIPQETTQLFKALLALPQADIPPLSDAKMQQLAPFIAEGTGRIDLGQVVSGLTQTGKIPPVLSEMEPLRPLFVFGDAAEPQSTGSGQTADKVQPQAVAPGGGGVGMAPAASGEQNGLAQVPLITSDGQVVTHTVQLVRGLVEAVFLASDRGQNAPPVMEQLSKGFTDLVTSILVEGKIPESLRQVEPIKQLLQASLSVAVKSGMPLQPVTSDELIQGFAQTAMQGKTLSPELHNETVAKVLSSLQGAEPKPELLRVLKQLVSMSQFTVAGDEEFVDGDKQSAKIPEAVQGLAKAASFFQSQSLVNHEVAQVGSGDCVLVPCFFAGQSGWGEWMWSHKQGEEQESQSQENLAFFLEMSHLGPVSIQAILGEKSLSAQFRVVDDAAYNLIVQGLPRLEERLNDLGYKAHFSCQQQPVAVIQEIKDSLESLTTGSASSFLVDIQA